MTIALTQDILRKLAEGSGVDSDHHKAIISAAKTSDHRSYYL